MTTFSFQNKYLRRFFFLRTELDRLLTASIIFSCGLIVFRILHTGSWMFVYMIWNLFLAYIPYALSNWLTASPKWMQQPLFRYGIFLAWLVFLPNTFYILTDLYHLHDSRHPLAPEWFDLALIFSCAWNGLLLGVLSLRQMEKLYNLPIYPIMALNAFGVYVGRYLRYNSWDILSNPFQLAADIGTMIIHPFRHQYAWNMIGCYTVLLIFIYTMMKKLSRALN
ncbi:DUF1361 domain-containing protein [Puia sp.]|jgi:uncharacterized membrane protein|uniref:DUF1361 domain-containing protein n=1 Tax=Puia sp. TaxID=2045100 RepID=UPI002F427A5B